MSSSANDEIILRTTASAVAEPSPSPIRRRKSRGKGLRVRTGCQSCRSRRVKCDESRPKCHACEKSDRECSYPSSVQSSRAPHSRAGRLTRAWRRHGSRYSSDNEVTLDSHHDVQVDHENTGGPEIQVDDANVNIEEPILPMQDVSQPTTQANETGYGSYDADVFGTSPDSARSGWPAVSAEAASLWWFGLLATDATGEQFVAPGLSDAQTQFDVNAHYNRQPDLVTDQTLNIDATNDAGTADTIVYQSEDVVVLSDEEIRLLRHFILHLSTWIDVTDPDRSFAVSVPQMALRNNGLMNAILALSARHLSLDPASVLSEQNLPADRMTAVQYYYETLRYLQQEMKNPQFLTSDELLATVLTISTYEMLDSSGKEWERHLKGVFWIQRSQTIHGESEGLKKRIWWAWLRQDIWVAFKNRRKILSFYKVTQACETLDFWALVDRATYLLGQCVNYGSVKEEEAGRNDVQHRLDRSGALWASLDEWWLCFSRYDQRLPTTTSETSAFEAIWINPPTASLAVQVYHFAKLLLLEYTPACGGLKELTGRQTMLQTSVKTICGIAACTTEDGPTIVSTQCLFGAGMHVKGSTKRDQVISLLDAHRRRTGWPRNDVSADLRQYWAAEDL